MKTRKSKKLLAAFLAVIMVLSTFAAMPFSSFAATYSLSDLNTLMTQYETKMGNGKTYTNLAAAYEAWYTAYRTYVGVKSGLLTEANIDSVYTALNTQMGRMTEWSQYTAGATAAEDGSYTQASLVENDKLSNALYAYGCGDSAAFNQKTDVSTGAMAKTRAGVQYGSGVFVYDGTNSDIAMPISMFTERTGGTSRKAALRSMRVTTNDLILKDLWHGESTSSSGEYVTATSKHVDIIDNANDNNSNVNGVKRYSNTLYWTGNRDTFGSDYLKTYATQDWLFYNANGSSGSFTQSAPIYIINYAALLDAISAVINGEFKNITNYSYDTAKALIAAINSAENVNPQYTYDQTTGEVAVKAESTANAIMNAVNAINTAKGNLVSINKASYVTLADNYYAYSSIASGNNSNGYYTSDSFKTFKQAFDATTPTLRSISNGGIKMTDVTAMNDTLVKAYNGLVKAENYIDDTELQALFTQYYALTVNAYTAASYAAVTESVDAALKYYNNNSYVAGITLKENDEDTAVYNKITADVKSAMAGLRINHDYRIAVDGELVSYNSMIAEANALDGSLYANYNEVMDAVGKATATLNTIDNETFVNEATTVGAYEEVLKAIHSAIDSLQRAFTAIENGTVVSETYGSTGGYSANNIKTYLNNTVIQKTYFKTVSGRTSFTTEYNYTVNNQYYNWAANRGAQFHALGFGAYGVDTAYFGNDTMSLLWKEGGIPKSDTYTLATYHAGLMKTTGNAVAGENYINATAGTDNQKILGETTVTVNDLGIAAKSFVTPDIYEYIICRTGQGSNVEKFSRTNTDVKQTVTVIDISDLLEKVAEADTIVKTVQNNSFNCYTTESWLSFSNALTAAKANMPYTEMSNDDIVADCQTRYNNLNSAMNALVRNTDESAHQFAELEGSTHATCTEDGIVNLRCSICGLETTIKEDALGHDLTYTPNNDGRTHTVVCSRGDVNTVENCTGTLNCDVCGQSLYDPANWDAFNAAKADMEAALEASANGTVKYTAAALQQANTDIAAITYYNYTANEQAATAIDVQSQIEAQAVAITAAYNELIKGIADESVYDANVSKTATLNADAYNVPAVQQAVTGIEVTQTVSVNGKDYTGYNYDNYNMALGTALTENWIPYVITVYDYNSDPWYLVKNADGTFGYTADQAAATEFHYGDYVTAPNPNTTEEVSAWAVVSSTDNSSDTALDVTPQVVAVSAEYAFNVRGNMEFYTTSDAPKQDTYLIKFMLALDGVETGRVLDVQYVNKGKGIRFSNCNIPDNIPFYTIDFATTTGYPIANARTTITPTSDLTIVVNFVSDKPETYQIKLIDEAGNTLDIQNNKAFNELVTLNAEGAASYVNADNGAVLCYGSTYEFFACRDITVKALTTSANKGSADVIATPVIDGNGKVYIVGSFALPEGATIQSFGIVLDGLNPSHEGLSLADLDKANYVFNLSAAKYTNGGQNGNQFTVSFNANRAFVNGTYVAYAIYTDANGNTQYAYSDVIQDAVLYK